MASVLPTMCVAAMMDGRITPIALAVIVRMLLLGLIKPAFVVRHTAAWSVATLALVIVMMEAARVRLASPVRLANAASPSVFFLSAYSDGAVVDCSQECSTFGKCITMHHAALDYGPDQGYGQKSAGGGFGPAYGNWEADSLMLCACDWGMFGPECQTRMCPRGFDPLATRSMYYREINVTTNATSQASGINGTFIMSFHGFSFEFNANATHFDEAECKAAWESLDNIEQVTCLRSTINAVGGATYNIQFLAWPAVPKQNNIFNHEGNPSLSAFSCDTSGVAVWPNGNALCHIEDAINTDVREYKFCSGRGTCDFSTGSCSCYANFEGVACSSSVAAGSESDVDILLLYATQGSFENTILKLDADANPSDSFNFLELVSGGTDTHMFTIEGDGDVTVAVGDVKVLTGELLLYSGLRIIDGGATILTGGIQVSAGGATVSEGGLKVVGNTQLLGHITASNGSYLFSSNASGYNDANVMEIRATHDAFAGAVLEVGAHRNLSDSFDLFRVAIDNGPLPREVFAITGQGRTMIKRGGLSVTGATALKAGGLLIEAGGITVNSGGLTVSNVGIASTGSITVTTGSITASSGTLTVAGIRSSGAITSTTSFSAAGLVSTASLTVSAGSITASGGTLTVAGIYSNGPITNANTFSAAGLTSTASLTVTAGSITASGGTLTVAGIASSAAITGTTTLYAHGIESTAAITSSTSLFANSITSTGSIAATSYTTTSDGRYKINVTSLRNRANRLLELNGVSFQWRDISGFDNETHFGFIAQEVESVFPEIVRENSLGVRSLQLEAIAPLLLEAFRALNQRVSVLEGELI